MLLKEYKGKIINVEDYSGLFSVEGGDKSFATLKESQEYADKLVLMESKKGCPMKAIHDMKLVTITSFNLEDKSCWYTNADVRRQKGNLFYSNKPGFFKDTADNMAIIKLYDETVKQREKINRELERLEGSLSDPILPGSK